ncbi:kinase domain protein (macronuclear) [Tetrahymena thermophila SB210]|uniref:Kinase domain protein n=1 Tax=Tetrahymena thermophila (strain SB210) TaxID=312017 RepID=I7M8V6_TETTS|nr:kinase domain protein [Tetrahymena thermophila SB210]EAR99849.2 kinase domain protein [Tetrahymena thermophila SB210]|eukprot:XP_001020094.2 kinase domain protein [Tetrahymena thermophila SB210]
MCTIEKLVTLTYSTNDLSTTVSNSMQSLRDTMNFTTKSILKNKLSAKKGGEIKSSIELEYTQLNYDENFRAHGAKIFEILKNNPYLNEKYANFEFIAAGGFGLVFKAKKKVNNNKPNKIYEERELAKYIAFKFMLNDLNAKREIAIMKKLFQMSTKLLMARNIQVFRRYEIVTKENGTNQNACRIINSDSFFENSPKLVQSASEGTKDKIPYVMVEMSKATFSVDAAISYRKKNKKPYFIYEINKIISNVLECLFIMHIQGIAHLDVKPQNILFVDELNRYTLADFGCSLELNSIDFENYQLATEEIVGFTPQYTDPNILEKEFFNPFKADIWSVGVILLELLSVGQDFDLVQILKTCKSSQDVEEKIFKKYIFNSNGEMIYCPMLKNFVEIDNQLKMYLQWDENQRWNIIEILIEIQNSILVQPFYIPFNNSITTKKLFSFLSDEQPHQQSSPLIQQEGQNNSKINEKECPYLKRQQQIQQQNYFLSECELVQGWKYRGFVWSNYNLQQTGLYFSQKNILKNGKGTISNMQNRLVFQGNFDRDLPIGKGTYVLSNFCDRKAQFTGIPSIDQILVKHGDQSLNDVEKIVYEGEFDSGQISGGLITYTNTDKGTTYLLNRSFRCKEVVKNYQKGKIVSVLDLNSKHISINLKCFRQSIFDKIFYVSTRIYPFTNYKSIIFKQNDTISSVMQKIKSRIIDTDTKFIQRLQTGNGYNFYFEQSVIIYSYFLSIFNYKEKFVKQTIIQDTTSQYTIYDIFLLFEQQVVEQIMSTMQYIKRIKQKGRISHDQMCLNDFYKKYKGLLNNLEQFCDNRDVDSQNFQQFGLNKQIKSFGLNCTSYVTEKEQLNIDKRKVANDQQVFEYLELKNMKRLGMQFVTDNYFEKYLNKSFNTLEYLNISFYSNDVKADFSCLKSLQVLSKFKVFKASPQQIKQIFENLNLKNLKTIHLQRQCEYDQSAIDTISQQDYSFVQNFKFINYNSNQGKWFECIINRNNSFRNLKKLCVKTYISKLSCTLISQKLKNIETLKLCYCQINDESISELKQLFKVTSLNLSSNEITDEGTKYLFENMPNVKNLKLNGSQNISFKGLYLLSSNMKHLEEIEFKNNLPHFNYFQFHTEKCKKSLLQEKEKSGGIAFIESLYELKNLQNLRLAQMYEECFYGENHFVRNKPYSPEFIKSLAVLRLNELDLSDIQEDYLRHFLLAKGVSNANKLVLNPKINQISDEIALALISGSFNQLQHLSLSNCYNLSSKTIQVLLQNRDIQKTIKELYLNNTEFDDDCSDYLINFLHLFPKLEILSVKNCIDISEASLQKLQKKLQQNKISLIY